MSHHRVLVLVAFALATVLQPRASHAVSFWDGFWGCESTYDTAVAACDSAWGQCMMDPTKTVPECMNTLGTCRFYGQEGWATCIGSMTFDLSPAPPKCPDVLERFTACFDFMHTCAEQTDLTPDLQEQCAMGENVCYNIQGLSEC